MNIGGFLKTRQQLAVHCQRFLDHDALVELSHSALSRRQPQLAGPGGILVQAFDGARQRTSVLHRHQQPVHFVRHHLATAGHIGSDQRQGTRRRFNHAFRKTPHRRAPDNIISTQPP